MLLDHLKSLSIDELDEIAFDLVRVALFEIRANRKNEDIVLSTTDAVHNLPDFIKQKEDHPCLNNKFRNPDHYIDEIHAAVLTLLANRNEGSRSRIDMLSHYHEWVNKGLINELDLKGVIKTTIGQTKLKAEQVLEKSYIQYKQVKKRKEYSSFLDRLMGFGIFTSDWEVFSTVCEKYKKKSVLFVEKIENTNITHVSTTDEDGYPNLIELMPMFVFKESLSGRIFVVGFNLYPCVTNVEELNEELRENGKIDINSFFPYSFMGEGDLIEFELQEVRNNTYVFKDQLKEPKFDELGLFTGRLLNE